MRISPIIYQRDIEISTIKKILTRVFKKESEICEVRNRKIGISIGDKKLEEVTEIS